MHRILLYTNNLNFYFGVYYGDRLALNMRVCIQKLKLNKNN
jgi:hypothetical protein